MRLWASLTAICVVGLLGLSGYAGWNLRDLPRPGNVAAIIRETDVFDRSGQLIAQRSANGEFHIYETLSELGRYGPAATLASEDRGFYQHPAVDAPSLMRAAAVDLANGRLVEGGSTITQQLVKIELLGPEQSVGRKVQEGYLAWALERRYSKDEILEMYLNRVYYGHGAYGLASATKTYFGRDREPRDLTAAQAALLAGLLAAPSGLDPQVNWEGARNRQLYVLEGMRETGALSPAEEQQAELENIRSELRFDLSYRSGPAPQFLDRVMAEAEQMVGATALEQGGLAIHTTLDLGLQRLAEQSVAAGATDLKRLGVNNASLLAVRPATGEVLAWVGSANYLDDTIGGQYDLVRASFQPGSTFKPYVFAAALRDHRITLCTTLEDQPTDFGGFRPVDYDNRYLGPISARRALLLSRNVPAVEVAAAEGMDRVNALAAEMGISTPLANDLPTAIGASAVTMYDQVEAYGVFANQGRRVPLMDVTRIDSADGQALYAQPPGYQPGQAMVMTPAEAYLVTDVLKDYPRQWSMVWDRQMAGKSGTTGGSQVGLHPDAWMMAYSPDIVIGAWAGSTGADGGEHPTAAYGVNVGQTISARFINGLPAAFSDWYTRPPGLVQGRGGELFLPGTQNGSCAPARLAADSQGSEAGA
jgi:membrane peptidoglycan carboxypeptidase